MIRRMFFCCENNGFILSLSEAEDYFPALLLDYYSIYRQVLCQKNRTYPGGFCSSCTTESTASVDYDHRWSVDQEKVGSSKTTSIWMYLPLVGPGANDHWITSSDQPEEDTSKLSCTLFKPTFGNDRQLLYLTHVQSRGHVRIDDAASTKELDMGRFK